MAKPPAQKLAHVENAQLQALKSRFDAAHAQGVAALKRGDFAAAGEAIRRQRDILEEQRNLVIFRLHRSKPQRRNG